MAAYHASMPRQLTLGLILGAMLTGCAGHADPPPSTQPTATVISTTSTATPTTTTPTVPPTPTPPPPLPTLPAQAQQMTNESAIAYVHYWIDLANYAVATGDTAPMMAESEAGCSSCADLQQQIETSYRDGGRITDNLWTIHDVSVTIRNGFVFGVLFTFDQAPGLELDAAGTVRKTFPEDHKQLVAVIAYVDGSWKMTNFGTP